MSMTNHELVQKLIRQAEVHHILSEVMIQSAQKLCNHKHHQNGECAKTKVHSDTSPSYELCSLCNLRSA